MGASRTLNVKVDSSYKNANEFSFRGARVVSVARSLLCAYDRPGGEPALLRGQTLHRMNGLGRLRTLSYGGEIGGSHSGGGAGVFIISRIFLGHVCLQDIDAGIMLMQECLERLPCCPKIDDSLCVALRCRDRCSEPARSVISWRRTGRQGDARSVRVMRCG